MKRSFLCLMAAVLGLLAWAGAGCHSAPKAASGRFAAVELRGYTPGQIAEATTQVFEKHGYKLTVASGGQLLYEKEGSTMNNVAFGNWMSGAPVWVRVRAAMVATGEAQYRLQCQAFYVRDRGKTLQEEIKVSNFRSGPYQQILNEVARSLGEPARP